MFKALTRKYDLQGIEYIRTCVINSFKLNQYDMTCEFDYLGAVMDVCVCHRVILHPLRTRP
jgi:hypothetical protein